MSAPPAADSPQNTSPKPATPLFRSTRLTLNTRTGGPYGHRPQPAVASCSPWSRPVWTRPWPATSRLDIALGRPAGPPSSATARSCSPSRDTVSTSTRTRRGGRLHRPAQTNLVLLTHDHADHLDEKALARARRQPDVVLPPVCADRGYRRADPKKRRDPHRARDHRHRRPTAWSTARQRRAFHPRGVGNGYLLTSATPACTWPATPRTPGDGRAQRRGHRLPAMNLPYTMTPEMVADAARYGRASSILPLRRHRPAAAGGVAPGPGGHRGAHPTHALSGRNSGGEKAVPFLTRHTDQAYC